MYYLKILVSIVIITVKYSVICEDDLDDIRVNTLRSTLRKYKFNHPPSIPNYQPIPVAIVYEESSRQDKAVDIKASTTTKSNYVPNKISKNSNFNAKDSDSLTSTTNTNKENGAASTTTQPNEITLPESINTETKNGFGEKMEVGKEYKKDNEQNKATVTSKIQIKPENKQIKARIVGGDEIQIPVVIVYEEPRIIRKKIHVRNRPNQERVRGFTLKKIDEAPPTTFRPVSSTTNDATTFRVGTKFTIKQESQQPEIQSTKHETSTKRINEEIKTAKAKNSENTTTPKSGKRLRERVHLVSLVDSQQSEIQSTKHETSTKRINEERKTATPETSENTGTPKFGKRRRERDPLVSLADSQQPEMQSTKHETSTKSINEEIKTVKSKTSENTGTPKSEKRRRERDPVVPIIKSENRVFSHSGAFKYSYEGGDGTKAFSEGELKTFDEDRTGEAVVGGFSYKDKDGNDFSLSYTADENGYRPVGAHLPTSPPIPPAIARALLYLATKTTPEPVTEPIELI